MTTNTKPKRRKRRSRSAQLAERTITDVKRKKLQFLRDVSGILSDALGFHVRVSLAKPAAEPMSPDMRRASRLTKAQARRQMADSMSLPVTKHADGSSSFVVPRAKVFADDIGF